MMLVPRCPKCEGRSAPCADCLRCSYQSLPAADATRGVAEGAACPAGCGDPVRHEVVKGGILRYRYAYCARCRWTSRPKALGR